MSIILLTLLFTRCAVPSDGSMSRMCIFDKPAKVTLLRVRVSGNRAASIALKLEMVSAVELCIVGTHLEPSFSSDELK